MFHLLQNIQFQIKRTDHDHLMHVETGQIHEFKSQELQRLIEEIYFPLTGSVD